MFDLFDHGQTIPKAQCCAPNCSTKAGPCACPSPENWDGNFIPPRQMWPHCWGGPVGVRRDVGEKAAKPMRQEWNGMDSKDQQSH